MFLRFLACLICLPVLAQDAGQEDMEVQAKAAADLRARIEATPRLPFNGVHFAVQGSALKGLVSWLAVDGAGTIYEIRRGESADPVLVLDRDGRVLRSWGKGDYGIPHSIRIDAVDNVWTVEARLRSLSILRLAKSS